MRCNLFQIFLKRPLAHSSDGRIAQELNNLKTRRKEAFVLV